MKVLSTRKSVWNFFFEKNLRAKYRLFKLILNMTECGCLSCMYGPEKKSKAVSYAQIQLGAIIKN